MVAKIMIIRHKHDTVCVIYVRFNDQNTELVTMQSVTLLPNSNIEKRTYSEMQSIFSNQKNPDPFIKRS